MAFRGGDAPMDYKYDNSTGPTDLASPFPRGTPSQHGFKNMNPTSSYSESKREDSPTRFGAPAPFGVPQTPVSKLPSHLTQFSAVRDNETFEFSSGAENQSSPEHADNEDTPDVQRTRLNDNVTISRGSHSPTKANIAAAGNTGTSIFNFTRSGRGEIRKPHHAGIVRRGHKRKRREADRNNQLTHHPGYDSGSEDRSRPSSSEGVSKVQPKEAGTISAMLSFIHNHPNLPNILSTYALFILNLFLIFAIMLIVYSFWATIRQDVDLKSAEEASKVMAEMELCARNYRDNQCHLPGRVPALEAVCNNWEQCMTKDPNKVGRARISAHTFAEILNNFIEPMSYKLMVFISGLTLIVVCVPNIAFGYFKKVTPAPPPVYQQPPATPQAHPQWIQPQYPPGYASYNQSDPYFTPRRPHGDNFGLESSRNIDGRHSPTKRLEYR